MNSGIGDQASARTLGGVRAVVVLAWSVLGGAERGALETATDLRRAGSDVSVLALTSEDGRARDLFASEGIPWHSQPTDWHGRRSEKALQLLSLARKLRSLRPDVLLPYTSRPNVLCGLVWRTTGASLCVWNQQDVVLARKFGRRLTARAIRQTPLFIANSEAARLFLVTELGAPSSRVRVVLARVRAVDVDGRRVPSRAGFGIEDGALVVSMLAHLHGVKDHATLLRAWRLVLDEMEQERPVLLLAGRASGTEDSTKALAFDLELGRSVRFLGDVDDVDAVLAASDVAVLSSRSESRPHALLESAAAGLPIAGTDVPGIRFVVGEEQAVYLTPPGDAEALAHVLVELLRNPTLRSELGRTNRARVLESDRSGPTAVEVIADALVR